MPDATTVLESATPERELRAEIRSAAEFFHAREGDLLERADALAGLCETLSVDQRTAGSLLAGLVGDVVDPIVQVPTPDGRFVGVIDYHEGDGWYGYVDYDDHDGERRRVVCARCVEEATHDREVAHATAGDPFGSFADEPDASYEELAEAIRQHYWDAHDVLPDEVETGASLLSGTTIGGNTSWHAGNDGAGSGLDADTVDSLGSGQFLRSDQNDSTSGELTVGDDLRVSGGYIKHYGVTGNDGHIMTANDPGGYLTFYDNYNSQIILRGTVGGNVDIPFGDLDVSGDVSSGGALIADGASNQIVLGSTGYIIRHGSGQDVFSVRDNDAGTNLLDVHRDGTVVATAFQAGGNDVLTTADEGSLDAGTLDGQDSSAFAPSGHTHAHSALTGTGTDDHHAKYTDGEARAAINADADHGSTAPHDYFSGSHSNLTNVSANDHHTRYDDAEAIAAVNADADHGATADHDYFPGAHGDLTGVGANDHHARYTNEEAQDAVGAILSAEFAYDDAGNTISLVQSQINHDNLAGVSANDHHSRYTNEEAQDAVGNAVGANLAYDDASGAISVVDGSGSGLDADTLDGAGSGVYARLDQNETITGAWNFDEAVDFNATGPTDEGGEFHLMGAGTHGDINVDNFRGRLRVFGGAEPLEYYLDTGTLTLGGDTVATQPWSDSQFVNAGGDSMTGNLDFSADDRIRFDGADQDSIFRDGTENALALTTRNNLNLFLDANADSAGSAFFSINADGQTKATSTEVVRVAESGRVDILLGPLDLNNKNIQGVNNIVMQDSGASEGVAWQNWHLYESPDDLSNATGDFQFVNNGNRRLTVRQNGEVDSPGGYTTDAAYETANFQMQENPERNSLDFTYVGA